MSRERISLVDLGSHSARLVVFEYERGGGFRLIDEIREVIRLGEGVARTGRLPPEAVDRAVVALRTFDDYCRATGLPPVRIMATSAVRVAANRQALLDRIQDTSLEIEVLSGQDEATLAGLAVANSFTFRDAWVADLGGGSMQLARMADRAITWGAAYPLGAISATEKYLRQDPPLPAQVKRLERAVDKTVGARLDEIAESAMPLIAMGGTVRNLARAVQRRDGYPWPVMHGYFLAREGLEDLTEQLLGQSSKRRAKISGISPHRADIIVAGAVVFRRLLRRTELDGIHISGYGVREGALFQAYLPRPHLSADVRDASVRNLLWQYPQPAEHNAHVVWLSGRLFDLLEPLHGLGEDGRYLLRSAAWLHDIGKAIHYRGHEKHGEYLIKAEAMPGFDHREAAIIAQLVRHHRGDRPLVAAHAPFLSDRDQWTIGCLTVCLRLAEYLDRSRMRRVQDVVAEIGKRVVTLRLVAEGEAWVEQWETQKQADLFESVFAKGLEVVAASGC